MGSEKRIGKYSLGKTIGEGTFSKVKLGVSGKNGEKVAIKVIDKHMVMESNLKNQVKREIRTMKLLHHPNIVRIHEVIGTKTKIYIVMEYVTGGRLLDKMSYAKKLDECEARKLFQQLIDAVDYCHNKGVYHRDLKPENLLLDSKGNLKVSDFGLSALKKPSNVLNTRCGSPCYVAPERITIPDIIEDEWFKTDYSPACATEFDQIIDSDDDSAASDSTEEKTDKSTIPKSSSFINAFQLIAMSQDLDLSGFFEEQDHKKQTTRIGSKHTIIETIEKIEAAATDVRLSVEKMNNFKIKMHPKHLMTRNSRSYFDLSAQVIEVAPTHCVVEIAKSAGDLRMYNEFCESLSNLLKPKSGVPSESQDYVDQCDASIKKQDAEYYEEPNSEGLPGCKSA
ncbi:CBL-interacting serine/threonine-protein kinase 21 isoform X2 [Lotus japonicus]|uniref:CBL-interacting serine/threonine-protein kinase 21 isoform X2 n=1 Tax=Lotus japonicus TaxID=34305 RepID=UPI0025883A8E|nr:CBL-interacting serine/threonine-protein kinase 21 isoform X2 [Lotus japonicus]